MRIFTDLHHGDLYYSLHRLFVERLGHELYRPIGLDWFHHGYWKIANPYPKPIQTANQYLEIRKAAFDHYTCLNGEHYIEDDIYHIFTPDHNYYQKGITLKHFKEMQFDIIMPTFPGHDRPFELLRNNFQPKAKMIMQLGNFRQSTHLPNVLSSVAYIPRNNQNFVFYHQELNPNLFNYSKPSRETKNIYGIITNAPYLNEFNSYKSLMTDTLWNYYGPGSPNGAVSGATGVSKKMHEANIGWHTKQGVGHVTRGWLSIGRPLLTKMSLHQRSGGDTLSLLEPEVTCINLEANTIHENEKKIRKLLEPETNLLWSERVARRFRDIVNFDKDEEKIKKFLEELI